MGIKNVRRVTRRKERGRRSVSRVLSAIEIAVIVIHLGRPSPDASSNLPGSNCGQQHKLPYLVLLQPGFTLPLPLPAARCALTAPFHPYLPREALIDSVRSRLCLKCSRTRRSSQPIAHAIGKNFKACRSQLTPLTYIPVGDAVIGHFRYEMRVHESIRASQDRRYIFCGTFRRLAPPRRYLATCPVEPGLSSVAWQQRLPDRLPKENIMATRGNCKADQRLSSASLYNRFFFSPVICAARAAACFRGNSSSNRSSMRRASSSGRSLSRRGAPAMRITNSPR